MGTTPSLSRRARRACKKRPRRHWTDRGECLVRRDSPWIGQSALSWSAPGCPYRWRGTVRGIIACARAQAGERFSLGGSVTPRVRLIESSRVQDSEGVGTDESEVLV